MSKFFEETMQGLQEAIFLIYSVKIHLFLHSITKKGDNGLSPSKLTIRISSCEALELKVHIQSSEALKLKVCTQSSNALK